MSKENKGGLVLPSVIGSAVGLLIGFVFNKYYFAGSGMLDPMPLTHLVAGLVLGIGGGAVFFAVRKR